MIYTFTLISDEVDDFVREIKIDSEASFFDLHKIILESCCYTDDQMTSFFLCNNYWEKEVEITLEDMGTTSADEDIHVMRDTLLANLIEDEGQRLIYVFDPMAERCFFMELSQIEFNKNQKEAKVSRQHGDAPSQLMDFDEAMTYHGNLDLDEDFFGSESFNEDDIDMEGFAFSDGDPYADQ